MAWIETDLENVYKRYFGANFKIGEEYSREKYADNGFRVSVLGTRLSGVNEISGMDVFLPVTLVEQGRQRITINCCTIRAMSKRTIVRTAVPERQGTVKEEYSVGDWQFSIKGVLIGEKGGMPDNKMLVLREIYESRKPIYLYNGMTDIFMPKEPTIAIESIEFPEVEGMSERHRPFILTCESDNINDLIIV